MKEFFTSYKFGLWFNIFIVFLYLINIVTKHSVFDMIFIWLYIVCVQISLIGGWFEGDKFCLKNLSFRFIPSKFKKIIIQNIISNENIYLLTEENYGKEVIDVTMLKLNALSKKVSLPDLMEIVTKENDSLIFHHLPLFIQNNYNVDFDYMEKIYEVFENNKSSFTPDSYFSDLKKETDKELLKKVLTSI